MPTLTNFASLRRNRNLSQRELAETSGVSRATIANLETGRGSNLRLSTVSALAAALGVVPSVLLAILGGERPAKRGRAARSRP